ncbi:general secretion pathway protein GspK [Bdellovibrio sp. HCB337]|uniref:general secretion pathway protein GspK n=1 Tax=Bdellovibrio sp. HCB337 TaxID=3394358 RepID=UPI0039A4A012
MALIMAVTCVLVISWIAMEVSYDSLIEYNVNVNSLNRLKAYYAARAGVDLSLLRIKTYQQAQSQFGKQLGGNSEMLDQIWKFPFAWPVPVPDGLNAVDKDQIASSLKESIMDASYVVTIEDEGSKIDLGDLVSPSKVLQESTRRRILEIFQSKIKDDQEFQRKYGNYRFEELVNAITDWQSKIRSSANGGDKRAFYSDYPDNFPPNRAFRTIQEVRMVPGMNEDFYELLEPAITIYGMKAINPNEASKEVLKSLDPEITDEIADEIIKRRGDPNLGGPFKNKEDFWGFITGRGARLGEKTEETPLVFDKVTNFRIKSTGEYAGVSREIVAVVMDLQSVANTVKGYVDKEKQQQQQPGATPTPTPNNPQNPAQSQSAPLPKGPPRIVYWGER